MAFQSEGLGRIIARDDVSLKTRKSEAPGASGGTITNPAVELGDKAAMSIAVTVYSAPTGVGPGLIEELEGSDDLITWVQLGKIGSGTPGYAVAGVTAPGSISGTGVYHGVFPTTRYIRCKDVITGTSTPTFELSVGGNAS